MLFLSARPGTVSRRVQPLVSELFIQGGGCESLPAAIDKATQIFSQGGDFQLLYGRGWEHSAPFGSAPLAQCSFQARILLGARTLENHNDSQLLYGRGWEHSAPSGSARLPQCFFQARILLGARTLENHSPVK